MNGRAAADPQTAGAYTNFEPREETKRIRDCGELPDDICWCDSGNDCQRVITTHEVPWIGDILDEPWIHYKIYSIEMRNPKELNSDNGLGCRWGFWQEDARICV